LETFQDELLRVGWRYRLDGRGGAFAFEYVNDVVFFPAGAATSSSADATLHVHLDVAIAPPGAVLIVTFPVHDCSKWDLPQFWCKPAAYKTI
jgi:hypothetical protein